MQLPAGLTNLCFGFDFDQSLRNVQLVGLAGRVNDPRAMDDSLLIKKLMMLEKPESVV